jgi:hypothetical protein
MKPRKKPMIRLLSALLLFFTITGAARADTVTDTLFAEGIFSTLPAGQEIRYTHVRSGSDAAGFRPVADGTMVVAKPNDGAAKLTLVIEADGRSQKLADFSADAGNPVLLVFLESVVRSMATLTGGSPFYIHNRIKDSLSAGGTPAEISETFAGKSVAAQSLTLRPFEADPNAAKMGDFAGLTLRFVVSPTVPGNILSLSADTPHAATGYHETISLTAEGKANE